MSDSNVTSDLRTPKTSSSARHLATLALTLIGLCMAWYVHAWPHWHSANESIRLYFVQAVVETGRPELDSITKVHQTVPVDRSEFEGHIYMDKAPGLSFAAIPLYLLLRMVDPQIRQEHFYLFQYLSYVLILIPIILLALASIARWCRVHGMTERMAWITVAAIGLASPVFVYATLFFGHGLAAALIALAFFGLAGGETEGGDSLRRRLGAGLSAGAAGLVDTPVFILAALLSLYALLRAPSGSWRRRLVSALPFVTGVAVFALLQLLYNAWVLGNPFHFTYQYKGDATLAAIIDKGFFGFRPPSLEALYGTWIGARRGLLYHAPWLAVAIAGHLRIATQREGPARRRRDSRWLLGISLLYALFIAGFVDWPAGDCVGARHLLPIVPLLGVGLAPGLRWLMGEDADSLRADIARGAVSVTVSLGLLMAALPVMTFPYHFAQLSYPVLELNLPLLVYFDGYAHSLGNALGMGHVASAIVFALGLLSPWLIVWFLTRSDRSQAAPEPTRTTQPWRIMLSAVLIFLLWTAAIVSPIPQPQRVVQVARLKATHLLAIPLAYQTAYRWLLPK